MQDSLGFSDFRSLMDQWDEAVEKQEIRDIKSMVEGNDFVLFFTKEGRIFGAPEESRLTFARMKVPDEEEDDPNWLKEATFMAINLSRALEGERAEAVFGWNDMNKIKIIDVEEAIKKLVDESNKIKDKNKTKVKQDLLRDEEPDTTGET